MLARTGPTLKMLMLLPALLLAGCNDEKEATAVVQTPAAQVETAKYNGYVTVANINSNTFQEALAKHLTDIAPALKSDKPIERFEVVPVLQVTNVRKRLDDALAREGSIPEIDPVARGFAEALKAFDPVNGGLANYAESKGFMADGGKRAREGEAAYLAALETVAIEERAFLGRVQERDEKLTLANYENAPEGSVERYRAGAILHAKAAMKNATRVFTTPQDEQARMVFTASLDAMAGMVESWDTALRKEKPEGCPILQGNFNRVVAGGRRAAQSAKEGRFDVTSSPIGVIVQQEYNILRMGFASLIDNLNRPYIC